MKIIKSPVVQCDQLSEKIYLLKLHAPELRGKCSPGEFANIKVSESDFPLLRRPFSICDFDEESGNVSFMFDVHGAGTQILATKKEGDILDVLIPLGIGFNVDGDFETAVILGGGIGVAPFPFLVKKLQGKKEIVCLIGGRSQNDVIDYGLVNVSKATDDGSLGFNGNVIQLFNSKISEFDKSKIRVFACGPTPMLRAAKEYCELNNIDCQVSTESAMACGFGLCQGCNCESTKNEDKYLLICKDGPVFNSKDVIL